MQPGDPNHYPGLAVAWEVSPDLKTYTLKLRQDVVFHDGTPLNAAALKFTWDRIANPETRALLAATVLGPYESSEVVDEYTLRVHFNRPNGAFLDLLAEPLLAPISPAAVQSAGADYALRPVGTGPFMVEEYVPNDHLTLVRNPRWHWGPSFLRQRPPEIERIVYRYLPDDVSRIQALEAGALTIADRIPPSDLDRLRADGRFAILRTDLGGSPWFMALNLSRPPTDERAVREAILLGINREAMIDQLFRGVAEPAYLPLERPTLGYDEALTAHWGADPPRAAEVLSAAGWEPGPDGIRRRNGKRLSLTWIVWPGSGQEEPAAIFRDQLREIGIEVKIESYDVNTAFEAWLQGKHNIAYAFFIYQDPSVLHLLYGSDLIGATNWTFYRGPAFDAMMAAAESTLNRDLRARLYGLSMEVLRDDVVTVPTHTKTLVLAAARELEGIRFSPTGYPLLVDARFTTAGS